ncbi:uncharacterized protein SAPINGB_P000520 [Magnusiomyces paraingens]|uniref:AMP-dependent synthetase/ligase domain-containing protein n=1 Tax=Magnusiomyces paraingens TaxID=2606893 RepID=A0A5E8B1U4_9ASCO|nr:uncharacterized protein SAPINGB_P000520 [Saprochaete ingens]VVT44750.1 unnamed protein product [Saprochaete ingens]
MSKLIKRENGTIVHKSPWDFDVTKIPESNLVDFIFSTPGYQENLADPNHQLYIDGTDSTHYLTVKQHQDLVGRIAYLLKNKFSINVGDTVCLFLTNSIYLPSIHLGILSAGAVISPANIAYLPKELHHQLNITKAKIIISLESLLPIAEKAVNDLSPVEVQNIIPFKDFISLIKDERIPPSPPIKFTGEESQHRHAYYCFSSGTSGVPKGVITSHYNIVSNITQHQISVRGKIYKPNNTYSAILPMSHIYGISVFIYSIPSMYKTKIIVFEKFHLETLLQKIGEHGISFLHVVPPMAVLLAKSPVLEKYLSSVKKNLKGLITGAAPLSKSLIDEISVRLDNGIEITQSYGLTETSPTTTFASYTESGTEYDVESCGWLLPGLEARLVDENGKDIEDFGFENRGEVWFRGPNVMKGYLRNPEATKDAFDDTGEWLRTGDVGVVTKDGQWYIVDRFKELIKSKSHQVAPTELEGILLKHHEVADAAVAGIYLPDKGTELPRAFIVPASNSIDPLAIKAWFDDQVARYKQLWGGVVVVEKIPKSPSGKILRRLLQQRKNDEVFGYLAGSIKTSQKL